MQTLWTFGCSHTQGHGLPDCVNKTGDPINNISSMAWPVHLGNLLNMPVQNISHAGIGVKAVHVNVVQSPIAPDDVIVIMWPDYASRIDVLLPPRSKSGHAMPIKAIRAWHEEDQDFFNKYYSMYDQIMTWHLLARHIQDNYSHQNKLIQTNYSKYEDMYPIPDALKVKFAETHFGDSKYCDMPLAEDGHHNGVEAHEAFAQDLYAEAFS